MAGSTVDTQITLGVTLGTPGYASPLTITNTGTIAPLAATAVSATGTIALYAPDGLTAPNLLNDGMIEGGAGGPGSPVGYRSPLYGGAGGAGIVLLNTPTITNFGEIAGGAGGNAPVTGTHDDPVSGTQAGNGGTGAVLGTGATIANYRLITGGAGGGGLGGGGGGTGVYVSGNAYISNSGTITGGSGGYGGNPLIFGALIFSGAGGIGMVMSGAATVVNSGTITGGEGGPGGDGGEGIDFEASGLLENSGTIKGGPGFPSFQGSTYGATAVEMSGGTIVNSGYIAMGTPAAPDYRGEAIYLNNGTLINAGTIAGRVELYGHSTLVVDPGAISGFVTCSPDAGSVLIMAGTSAGRLGDFGYYTNFATFDIATGANWTIYAAATNLYGGQTINGFAGNDQIILDGTFATSPTYVAGTGLELTTGASTITLDITGNFTSADFTVTNSGGHAILALAASAPCFAAGTRILTPRGDIAVENLAIGDLVITKDGEDIPITWIGQRHLKNLAAHPSPELVQPVLIAASAFQNGVPSRDLVLSPDHALYLSACLIPARSLINGANILQLNRTAVTYYHIELAHHDIIFAENTAVETYLDTGNRAAFENTGPVTTLHPDFMQHLRNSKSCAPFIDSGPIPASHSARALKRAVMPSQHRLAG
jgi:hypothetical protein